MRAAAASLADRFTAVEEALYQTTNRSPQDPLNFPIRLNNKLAALAGSVAMGDSRPTDQARTVEAQLTAAIGAQLAQLDALWAEDLAALNALAAERGVPAVAASPTPVQGASEGRTGPGTSRASAPPG